MSKDNNRIPLPGDNWIEFEGTLVLGEFWKVQEADQKGDTRTVAGELCKIVKAWSFEGDPNDLSYDGANSWAGFDLLTYRAIATAAGQYLGRERSGN